MQNKAYTWGWVAILAILFGYELYALIFGHGKDWPLTWVTIKNCPWWLTMSFLTWLWVHFAVRYAEGASYIQKIMESK
jgi:hypothetical protein